MRVWVWWPWIFNSPKKSILKRSIIIFIILSTIASAINYFAYPALGRILPATQYIDITIALSLFTQITTFLSSINAITVGFTKDNTADPKRIIHALQSSLFKVFALLIVLFLISSPLTLHIIGVPLQFSLPISLLMLTALPLTIMSGYLNGKQLMVKLGVLAIISAGFQFTFGVVAALIFHDGFITMTFMALAQICAIASIQYLFRSENLPNPLPSLKSTKSFLSKKVILYATVASIAIMLINLIQIADLLLITRNNSTDAKFYTDLYIISRIMFFAGMIFIWPFLGSLDVKHTPRNRPYLFKLIAIFVLIAFAMIIPLGIFGSDIVHLLLNVQYETASIALIGGFSIVFKVLLLIATAITLYFMVMRSWIAIYYSLALSALVILYSTLIPAGLSTLQTIQHLTIIASVSVLVGLGLFAYHTRFNDVTKKD